MPKIAYKKLSIIVFLFYIFNLLSATSSNAQENIHLRWAKHNPTETKAIKSQPMSGILDFLTVVADKPEKNTIFYKSLSGKMLDYTQEYQTYLEGLSISSFNKNEQLAYWLNLHNLIVIQKIAENTKVGRKIKKLRGIPGKAGTLWSEKVVTVEGVSLSLEDIEQNILIQHWQDANILYGLFYGVKGSAFFGVEGFSGAKVHHQLASMAENFVNNSKNIKVKKGKVKVSSLLAWNKTSLFANDDKMLINHLLNHAKGKLKQDLAGATEVHKKHKFSWTSNIYKPRKPRKPRTEFTGSSGGGS